MGSDTAPGQLPYPRQHDHSTKLKGGPLSGVTINVGTLNSPTINSPTVNGSGGALTLPAGPDTLVGRATTDTLTNKTLTSPLVNGATASPTAAANTGLVVKGLASQSGNLQEWQSSTGAVLGYFAPSGDLMASQDFRLTRSDGTAPALVSSGLRFVPNGIACLLIDASGGFHPGNGGGFGGALWGHSGAPSTTLGAVGDFYFRADTPTTANQRIYIKTAAAVWTGIL